MQIIHPSGAVMAPLHGAKRGDATFAHREFGVLHVSGTIHE